MKKKLLALIMGCTMVAGLLAGCSGGDKKGSANEPADSSAASKEDASAEKQSYKIGLSLEGLDHNYMITLRDQVLAAAEAYTDADVTVVDVYKRQAWSCQMSVVRISTNWIKRIRSVSPMRIHLC